MTKPMLTCGLAVAALLIVVPAARAHPLGNESVVHFSMLHVLPDRIELDFLLDIAEGPSVIVRRDEIDADRDGEDTDEELKAWLVRKADQLAPLLVAKLDGQPITFKPIPEETDPETGQITNATRILLKLPGVAGMPTYRLVVRYSGQFPQPLTTGTHELAYEDTSFPERLGLMRTLLRRETSPGSAGGESGAAGSESARSDPTVAGRAGPRVIVHPPRPPFMDECPMDPLIYEQYDPAKMPREKKTRFRFTVEPAGALNTATQAVTATTASVSTSAPALGADRISFYVTSLSDPRNDPAQQSKYQRDAGRLIKLLREPWGLTVFLTITALCFGWGAAHALMPGHAKTLVAAYLISQRGTWWHAVLLAVIVTITHTALVVLLGVVIWAYQKTHPDLGQQLQLWLGTIAGLLIAGMGAMLIWRAWSGRSGHRHHHDHHDHGHAHDPDHHHHQEHHSLGHEKACSDSHGHEHSPDRPHRHGGDPDRITVRLLLLLGITGGIVPCPTATIIMFLGIGTNVILGALYAVGIFSLGLALTLMAIGFLALYSRRYASRLLSESRHEDRLSPLGQRLLLQLLPAASGLVVVTLGLAITAHYFYYMRTGLSLFGWIQW
ncbi:MAG: hypothetical protein KA354_18785 [Phycisphaerae bacterium]|nr:hypothetical protein [Phycisphaerae bacterium]